MDYSKSYIKQILNEVKTIALVGASSREERDSFKVMKSLLENGYEVFLILMKSYIRADMLQRSQLY